MKPIDYYTTLSEDTAAEIEKISRAGKIFLIAIIGDALKEEFLEEYFEIKAQTIIDISTLNHNQALGLIKGLADQCQETLIAK